MKADWFALNVEKIEEETIRLRNIAIKWLELPDNKRQNFFNEMNFALDHIAKAKEVLYDDTN